MAASRETNLATIPINEKRQWDLLMSLAVFGEIPGGGVNRQALSDEDISAKKFLVDWGLARGFDVRQDSFANLFIRRPGTEPDLDPVMTGSHLDSQPSGGRFDGAYGVVAGLEVLEALNEADIPTKRSIEVAAWTNEEGSRFTPGAMGSSVFAGTRKLEDLVDVVDRSGDSIKEELARNIAALKVPLRTLPNRAHSYIEAHIEQGPVLDEAEIPVAIVTGIQGIRRIQFDIIGTEAHAGTTPRHLRRDALFAAHRIAAKLYDMTADRDDVLRFTIGRFEVAPGSPNTVPGHVHFTVDLRHADLKHLERLGDRISTVAETLDLACRVEVSQISLTPPTVFPDDMIQHLRGCAESQGLSFTEMPSGAGHDAIHMARFCPSAMIFVPCLDGISHNIAESAQPDDLAIGTQLLAGALMTLSGQ